MTTKKDQAILCMEEGKYADAIPLLFEIGNGEIKEWILYYAVGKCYLLSGQADLAHRFLETARQLNKRNAEVAYALGETCMLLADYKNAINAFEDVVSLYPNRVAAYNKLGLLYARMGQFENALSRLHRGLEQIVLLERTGVKMNDEVYRGILKTEMDLGYVFPNSKEEDTMDIRVIKAMILNNIGVCHYEKHSMHDASIWFEKALETIPEGVSYNDPMQYMEQMKEARATR